MSMSAENLWKGIPINDEVPQRACVGCGVKAEEDDLSIVVLTQVSETAHFVAQER